MGPVVLRHFCARRSVLCGVALATLLAGQVALPGCEEDGEAAGSPDASGMDLAPSGGTITITAQLVDVGSAKKSAAVGHTSAALQGDALEGYSLYCVTFEEEPEAGSGTADANGDVTLTMDAQNVPMGCFVLDDSDDTVAVLLFNQSGGDRVQTILLTGSSDLGSIAVDLGGNMATVDLPGEGAPVNQTPVYAPCPTGMWTTTIDLEQCPGGTTIVLWIARSFTGDLFVSSTTYNTYMGEQGCGDYSQILSLSSYSDVDKEFSMSMSHRSRCDGEVMDFDITYGMEGTFNAECSELNGVGYTDPSDPCDPDSSRTEQPITYVRM